MASSEESGLRRTPPGQLYRIAWFFYLVIAVAAVFWLGLDPKAAPQCNGSAPCLDLFVNRESWPLHLGVGVLGALAVVSLWEMTKRALPLAKAMDEQLMHLVGPLTPSEAAAIALLSGFSEEFFFRGAVQGSLGWLFATIAFALLHTGPSNALRLWSLYAAAAGLLFSGLTLWTGNLLAPITAHILINGIGLWRMSRQSA
ncbi:MAG: CPBP family intramembrane metalloprotease [Deltaproteobacteria bacterium]|nr:CPBP family intramembrane metalloprotease [Deltaproteobacteria bacterium]